MSARSGLVALCLALLAGCSLNPDALYLCETDSSCVQDGYTCWSDGYCHPPADGAEDAGRDAGAKDSGVDAGGTDAGTPDAGESDAGFDAGEPDAGDLDAGFDAGLDAGCLPTLVCPSGAQCGYLDAGCGVELNCGSCVSPMECGVTAPFTCGLPRVCTPLGVCWEHPLPQGNALRIGWPIAGRRAWLAGDNGTILEWTGEHTVFTDAPPLAGTDILALHGASPTEAFAAGTNGLILAWDGSSWTSETVVGGYSGTLNGVAAVGAGRAVAVGPGGLVVWRDPLRPAPDRWLQDTTLGTGANLGAVHVSGGVVFVAASNRNIYRATSATSGWTLETTLAPPGGVSDLASAAGVVFALEDGRADGGQGSRILVRSAPGTWDLIADLPDRTRTLRGARDTLWTSGFNVLTVLSLDGGLVARAAATRDWAALAPTSDDSAVLGGPGGLMAFAFGDGGVQEHVLNNGAQRLGKLCAIPSAGGQVLVATSVRPNPPCPAGCFTRLMERRLTTRGYEWISVEVQVPGGTTGADTLSCQVDTATLGWATTNSRYMLYRTSTGNWASVDPGPYDATSYAVWGPPSGPWDFVGDNGSGALLRNYDGGVAMGAFTVSYSGFWSRLRTVTGVGRTNAVAVGAALFGQNGAFAKLQGNGTWSTNDYGPTMTSMTAISGRGSPDGGSLYVAVGSGGAVWTMRNYANNFTNVTGFPPADLRDVWLSPSGDGWMVGDGGAPPLLPRVQTYLADGGRAVLEVPVAHGLSGVFGAYDADAGVSQVWVTGENGTVLTFTR